MPSPSACILLADDPKPGRVKQRLAAKIGPELAARLCESMLLDLVDRLYPLSGLDLFVTLPATEDAAAEEMRARLPQPATVLYQHGTGFGQRCRNALAQFHQVGYERLVLVRADFPTLPSGAVLRALANLSETDVVLGPCAEGGWYLLACSTPQPHLFADGAGAAAPSVHELLTRCGQAVLSTRLLPSLPEVETFGQLCSLYQDLRRRDPTYQDHLCPRTFLLLESTILKPSLLTALAESAPNGG